MQIAQRIHHLFAGNLDDGWLLLYGGVLLLIVHAKHNRAADADSTEFQHYLIRHQSLVEKANLFQSIPIKI